MGGPFFPQSVFQLRCCLQERICSAVEIHCSWVRRIVKNATMSYDILVDFFWFFPQFFSKRGKSNENYAIKINLKEFNLIASSCKIQFHMITPIKPWACELEFHIRKLTLRWNFRGESKQKRIKPRYYRRSEKWAFNENKKKAPCKDTKADKKSTWTHTPNYVHWISQSCYFFDRIDSSLYAKILIIFAALALFANLRKTNKKNKNGEHEEVPRTTECLM